MAVGLSHPFRSSAQMHDYHFTCIDILLFHLSFVIVFTTACTCQKWQINMFNHLKICTLMLIFYFIAIDLNLWITFWYFCAYWKIWNMSLYIQRQFINIESHRYTLELNVVKKHQCINIFSLLKFSYRQHMLWWIYNIKKSMPHNRSLGNPTRDNFLPGYNAILLNKLFPTG